MKEKPILLNTEMVRAVLDGRKMQTRRVMKVQPHAGVRNSSFVKSGIEDGHGKELVCPFGEVGDRLWVRESFAAFDDDWIYPGRPQDLKDGPWPNVVFPADGVLLPPGTCRSSIHMPRWASRITLEITGVRVERLASISNEDARNEGYPASPAPYGGHMDPWLWFRQLWDGIYPDQSFKVNPWVWVIDFKRVEE